MGGLLKLFTALYCREDHHELMPPPSTDLNCDFVSTYTHVTVFTHAGSSNGPAEYRVKIELKRNGVILGCDHTKFLSDGSSNAFPGN